MQEPHNEVAWTLPGPGICTGRRTVSSLAVLLAALATTLVPAAPSQAADTSVTVDFSTAQGAPAYQASGMIYGMTPDAATARPGVRCLSAPARST